MSTDDTFIKQQWQWDTEALHFLSARYRMKKPLRKNTTDQTVFRTLTFSWEQAVQLRKRSSERSVPDHLHSGSRRSWSGILKLQP